MIKSELIKTIAQKMTHLSEQRVEEAVNLILTSMTDALKNGQRNGRQIHDLKLFGIKEEIMLMK